MKKLVLSLAVFIAVSVSFTSCNEDNPVQIVPPMFGMWECIEIRAGGGGIVSLPTPINPELLRFFSINYVGVGMSGFFARVGADAGDLTGLLTGAGATEQDQAIWRNFLTTGAFVYTPLTPTTGTITHTANGVATTYQYDLVVSADGERLLILTEQIAAVGGPAVGGVMDMINLIFGGPVVNNAVYIQYVYRFNDRFTGFLPLPTHN